MVDDPTFVVDGLLDAPQQAREHHPVAVLVAAVVRGASLQLEPLQLKPVGSHAFVRAESS